MKQSSDVTTTMPTSDITDCGTQLYLHVLSIQPPQYDNDGIMIHSGDLGIYKGRYYLDEVTSTLKCFQGDETHLYGKHVRVRSVMFCRFTTKGNYCQACVGKPRSEISGVVDILFDQFRHKNLLSEGRGLFLDLLRTAKNA